MLLGIGKDIEFGLDNFQNPRMGSKNDAIARSLLNLLLMKPGQLPSMPSLGIDIYSYLYGFEEEIDTETILDKIQEQCGDLLPFIDVNNTAIVVIPKEGLDLLMLVVPIFGEESIIYAFSKKNNTLLFDYKFDKNLL